LADFLSTRNDFYDVISTSNVTDWAPRSWCEHLARSCRKALKPDGLVVCRTMHGNDPTEAFEAAGMMPTAEEQRDASGLYEVRVFCNNK
jgi:hypothetical protein